MKHNLLTIEDIRKNSESLFFLLEEIEMNFGEMSDEKKQAFIGMAFELSGKVASWIYREEKQREKKQQN